MIKNKIAGIYENIYNKELENRYMLDNKFSSRLTILLALITAYAIIITTIYQNPKIGISQIEKYILSDKFKNIVIVIILTSSFLLLNYFFKSFFRFKKNYKVMPTVDIRMFHFYVYRNKLQESQEEDLYSYLVDSYQFCAYYNAMINSKRETSLIKFDLVVSISFIISICIYLSLCSQGVYIKWLF